MRIPKFQEPELFDKLLTFNNCLLLALKKCSKQVEYLVLQKRVKTNKQSNKQINISNIETNKNLKLQH